MSGAAQQLAKAQAAHREQRLDDAERAYAQVSEMTDATSAQRADAHYGLGTVFFQRGELEKALGALDAALRSEAGVAEYHFNRALVLERLRRRDDAIGAFLRAVELANGHLAVLRPAVERLLHLNAWREALTVLQQAPQGGALDGLRARALAGAGDWAGACALARRLTQAEPADPQRWQWRSQAAAALRDYDDATTAHARYLALRHPATAEDHLAHADLLLSARRPQDARTALVAAKAAGAQGVEWGLLDARLARLEGDLPAAAAAAWEVLALRGDDGRAWQLLTELLRQDELAKAADRLTEILQAQEPFRPGHELLLRFALARVKERQGELADAWHSLEVANALQQSTLVGRAAAYDAARETEGNTRRLALFSPLAGSARDLGPSDGRPRVLFILGMPRSGTTLMERIVGGLGGVHAGGENEAMTFIAATYEHEQQRGRAPAPDGLQPADWQALREDYFARSLPSAAAELALLTDKMPHNLHHVGLIAGMFADAARVLWMRRHPLDVCLSIYSRRFPDGHRYACDLQALAHFYAESERLMSAWRDAFPWLVHEVRYEALAADPEPHARAVADLIGLPWDAACLDTAARREAAFTFSELQVREAISERHVHRHRPWGELLDPLRRALNAAGVAY